MCLTIAEGRYLVQAARKFKTVTQVGTQQRSMPINNWASDLVKNGALGKVHTVLAPNFVGPEKWPNKPAQPMPQGGVLNINAQNVTLPEDNPFSLRAGRYIKIMVKDQGVGIWPDHLSKIFDPYFTTKQKGSGLGLTTSYSIIKNHDGHITVDSAVGQGTIFSLFLPAAAKKYVPEPEAETELRRGKGRILVMDTRS